VPHRFNRKTELLEWHTKNFGLMIFRHLGSL
jgi:hypothetical protein